VWWFARQIPPWNNCNILETFAGSVSALQPYKSIFIETRGIALIQAMLLHGSPNIITTLSGTG
jgi:hypothetical protein